LGLRGLCCRGRLLLWHIEGVGGVDEFLESLLLASGLLIAFLLRIEGVLIGGRSVTFAFGETFVLRVVVGEGYWRRR